jgi:hypothetical protein
MTVLARTPRQLPAQISIEEIRNALQQLGIPDLEAIERVEFDHAGIRVTYMRETGDGKRFLFGREVAHETYDIGVELPPRGKS